MNFVIHKIGNDVVRVKIDEQCRPLESEVIQAPDIGANTLLFSNDGKTVLFSVELDDPKRKSNTSQSYIDDCTWSSTVYNIVKEYEAWQSRIIKLSKNL